jgi:hypothetical protein
MSKRAKLASIFGISLGFAGLILLVGVDSEITARKARIFAGLVRPLVDVFGTIGAAGLIVAIGLLVAAAVWFWPASVSTEPMQPARPPAGRRTDPLNRRAELARDETRVPISIQAMGDPVQVAIEEVLAVDSEVLRAHFLSAMQDGDLDANVRDARRREAFSAAFGDNPLPLTLDLYARLPARSRIPTPTADLRLLGAAFDAALTWGWQASLTGEEPVLRSTNQGWNVRLAQHAASLRLSDAQMSLATRTVGRLIAGGANSSDSKFERWYYFVVRAAAEDSWPKHRDALITMFSVGFNDLTHKPQHHQVLTLTEDLLKETPLAREDIPGLAEFDQITAELDAVRASVFAELGEPLGQAMAEVLDSGGGVLDRDKFPGLRSLSELSPDQRGQSFAQLLVTITGLKRHGCDHWAKLKRHRGRYRLGLNHDPDYSILPEMSFLFLELTRKKLNIPDRDRTVSAFMDVLPLLIYLQDRKSVEVVLDTSTKAPHGETADKLRALVATPMDHPFHKYRAAIEGTLALYPPKPLAN